MGRKRRAPEHLHRLRIESMAFGGRGVAHTEGGDTVFVEQTAPGDVVDVRVTKKKKGVREATPTAFQERSGLRVEPFCQHFGTCGGCKWQHLPYEKQLEYKQRFVTDSFERLGKLSDLPEARPILPSARTESYRNKLEYTFTNRRWLDKVEIGQDSVQDRDGLGFHVPGRFDKVLDVEECHLQADPSNAIRNALRDLAKAEGMDFFDIVEQKGFLRNLVIRTASTGDLMVILQVFEDQPENVRKCMAFLAERFPQITSLNYVVNPKGNETFFDLDIVCYKGEPYIEEEMEGLRFRVGPKSFYQTNSEQAYELYKVAREFAALTGEETVYDLYTGTGTIANFIAGQAKKVVGVESVAMAIEDAIGNAERNGVSNAVFYVGDMKDVLSKSFVEANGKPDVIVCDPPRAGMHERVCRTIVESGAKRVVYVSCNPATQARDLALMEEAYRVTAIQPVDMFPHSYHVENVALLERR